MEKSSPIRDNPRLASEIKMLNIAMGKQVPMAEYEFKSLVFPASARADFEIKHSLRAKDPEKVRWIVVGWGFASTPTETPFLYKDLSSSRRPWTPGVIRLRCNIPSASCRLLLFTEVD